MDIVTHIAADPTGVWSERRGGGLREKGNCSSCGDKAWLTTRYGRGPGLCSPCAGSPPAYDTLTEGVDREARLEAGAAQLAGLLGRWR